MSVPSRVRPTAEPSEAGYNSERHMNSNPGSSHRTGLRAVSAAAALLVGGVIAARDGLRSIMGARPDHTADTDAQRTAAEAPSSDPRQAGGKPDEQAAASPAASDHEHGQRTRREFLTLISLGMGGFAATIVAIPVIGALIAPLVRSQPSTWRPVGNVSDFTIGSTVAVTFEDPSPLAWAGVASQTAAWLRRVSQNQFQAFAVNCTHLGCPVRWLAEANLFMCPCHGGVFYGNGTVAAGPPQKPLYLYPVRIREGQVEVQASAVPIV